MSDRQEVSLDLFLEMNVPLPRYTSYPTAPEWNQLDSMWYWNQLQALGDSTKDISLYVHIPFCKQMCLYCACSVILNRRPENEERYVDYLLKEIDQIARALGKKKTVRQLHWGGGTPTQLSVEQLDRIFSAIEHNFSIDFQGEIAIEIDPRTVFSDRAQKLKYLKERGFNRVSFGVQDTNEVVQEAVKRRQSYEMTCATFYAARELGFKGINVDLIYGLPFQTRNTFQQTVEQIVTLSPDRIALFSYAQVPWLKPHQKAIPQCAIPDVKEKFSIYMQARKVFIDVGYLNIGMDHFARQGDDMARAYLDKTLDRNFQGYTVRAAQNLIGIGVTAIGLVENTYAQNIKELPQYYERLDQGFLPVSRGKVLNLEDKIRKWTIHTLMCDFQVDKIQFQEKWGCFFDLHFALERDKLQPFIQQKLVIDSILALYVTPLGQLFIRNIASQFDAYLRMNERKKQFSQAI